MALSESEAKRIEYLLEYMDLLNHVGISTKQLYSRHARTCKEVEKALDIPQEKD